MKIEKNYYDIMMQESDKIAAEIALEESLLSEGELLLEKEQRHKEAQHIIELANEKENRTWHVRNTKSVETFNIMSDKALIFAEKNFMNIVVESDSTIGKIQLTTPFVYTEMFQDDEDRTIFTALFETADDFMFDSENNLLRLNFFFNLTTTIEK